MIQSRFEFILDKFSRVSVTRGDHNTDYITEKVRKKIWTLRGMKNSGLTMPQLVDAYIKEVRSILELAVPVWGSGITVEQSLKIERFQKLH